MLTDLKQVLLMALSRDDKHVVRIIFRLKVIHESDKQTFENYFTKIMRHQNKEFQQVKPQGKFGDAKCDGFIKSLGIFYQVYAPEKIKSKEKVAVNKMISSFTGLQKYWAGNGFIINEFYYVVNDKYQGVYPSLHTLAKQIETDYKVKCDLFTAGNLEDIFLELNELDIIDVIGNFDFNIISDVEISSIDEVIQHILKIETIKGNWKIPKDPDFEKKIIFNKLCGDFALHLRSGRYCLDQLKEYFKYNGSYLKEDLREKFNGLYEEAKRVLPDDEFKIDEIFWYIVERSTPNKGMPIMNALFVVMAYYFEYCDIFETPPKNAIVNAQQGELF